ncbi:MAG: hypothetical protein EOP24_38135 [Hyphomicrobiales bacterium]|nr:MAG: hypothetical protein EOP24_38135 [Hyphomicrobiales bacterium]
MVADDASLIPYLIHYVAHRLASGEGMPSVNFPALPTATLIDGTQRGFIETARLAKKLRLEKTEQPRTLKLVSEMPLELHHHETMEILRSHLRSNSHVVVPLGSSHNLPQARETIARLDRMASEAGTHVMLVGTFGDGRSMRTRRHLAAEMFYAEHAEEDPHCSLAWSMGNSDRALLNPFGKAKIMVQVENVAGKLSVKEETFYAAKLIDRVFFKCHHGGLNGTETATVLGLSKSRVSRMIGALPKHREVNISPRWWDVYTGAFNFTEEVLKKLEAATVTTE